MLEQDLLGGVTGSLPSHRDVGAVEPAAEPVRRLVQRDMNVGAGVAREVVRRGETGDATAQNRDMLFRLLLADAAGLAATTNAAATATATAATNCDLMLRTGQLRGVPFRHCRAYDRGRGRGVGGGRCDGEARRPRAADMTEAAGRRRRRRRVVSRMAGRRTPQESDERFIPGAAAAAQQHDAR